MRYPPEHKDAIRERIVEAASRRFRRGGGSVGIAELMKALKLTHGGFYRHFRSKEELFAQALAKAFDDGRAWLLRVKEQAPPGRELDAIVRAYLSEDHCANTAGGCAVAALGAEVARQPRAIRVELELGLARYAAVLAPYVRGASEEERRTNAVAMMAGMSGALATARAVASEPLRKSILESARETFSRAYAG